MTENQYHLLTSISLLFLLMQNGRCNSNSDVAAKLYKKLYFSGGICQLEKRQLQEGCWQF